jgi:hypothetical protein
LPSLSVKYAATPISPTCCTSPTAAPPCSPMAARALVMSSTSIVMIGLPIWASRWNIPPPM